MRVLICNDDGIMAPGLKALIAPIKSVGYEVFVAAPSVENSATSHAITTHDPIFVDGYIFSDYQDVKAWSISGRPADCVKMALEVLMLDNLPDLVVSGINRGPNLGLDTVYSGTVSAALEASMHNIPAMAISLNDRAYEADYNIAADVTVKIMEDYKKFSLLKNSMLNINVPAVSKEELRGICVTKLGNIAYDNTFEERKNLHGRSYYWLGGCIKHEKIDEDNVSTDIYAVQNNWVAVTPLNHDLTDQKALAKIQDLVL